MKQSIFFCLPVLGLDVPYESPTASYSQSRCYWITAVFDNVFANVKKKKKTTRYTLSNAAIVRASSLKLKPLKTFGKRHKFWRRLLKWCLSFDSNGWGLSCTLKQSIITSLLCRFVMSSHLQWMIIRNCSSFLIKRNGQTYSTVSNCVLTVSEP